MSPLLGKVSKQHSNWSRHFVIGGAPWRSCDPYHPCPVCDQPTENPNLCDNCIDNVSFMLRRYEADMHWKREPNISYRGA